MQLMQRQLLCGCHAVQTLSLVSVLSRPQLAAAVSTRCCPEPDCLMVMGGRSRLVHLLCIVALTLYLCRRVCC
jgi:hypothetical protein